jgi:hypothetical protein
MSLDLESLLANARAQARLNTPTKAYRAREQQRLSADQLADVAARNQNLRDLVHRGLTSIEMDSARFRWLSENNARIGELAGQTLEEMRKTIDDWQRQQAIRRLAEMRKRDTELRASA